MSIRTVAILLIATPLTFSTAAAQTSNPFGGGLSNQMIQNANRATGNGGAQAASSNARVNSPFGGGLGNQQAYNANRQSSGAQPAQQILRANRARIDNPYFGAGRGSYFKAQTNLAREIKNQPPPQPPRVLYRRSIWVPPRVVWNGRFYQYIPGYYLPTGYGYGRGF